MVVGWILMRKSQHWGLRCILHSGNCPIQDWCGNSCHEKQIWKLLSEGRPPVFVSAVAHPPSWWKSVPAAKAVGGRKNCAKIVQNLCTREHSTNFWCNLETAPIPFSGLVQVLHQEQHLHFWWTAEGEKVGSVHCVMAPIGCGASIIV